MLDCHNRIWPTLSSNKRKINNFFVPYWWFIFFGMERVRWMENSQIKGQVAMWLVRHRDVHSSMQAHIQWIECWFQQHDSTLKKERKSEVWCYQLPDNRFKLEKLSHILVSQTLSFGLHPTNKTTQRLLPSVFSIFIHMAFEITVIPNAHKNH